MIKILLIKNEIVSMFYTEKTFEEKVLSSITQLYSCLKGSLNIILGYVCFSLRLGMARGAEYKISGRNYEIHLSSFCFIFSKKQLDQKCGKCHTIPSKWD